jgi:PAS domain-containing protein
VPQCPECGHVLGDNFQDQQDPQTGEYLAEHSQLCPHCGYKDVVSRVAESGQILFASIAADSSLHDIENLFARAATQHSSSVSQRLKEAIESVPDICLIADDDRRFVEVNQAAIAALKVTPEEIIGRRIDDFFAIGPGISVPYAWHRFVSARDQFGTCELLSTSDRFEYRARTNILPGLHVSLLRRVPAIKPRRTE